MRSGAPPSSARGNATAAPRLGGSASQGAGVPFESRILIHADGSVVIENAGERLEELPSLLASFTDPGQAREEP